MAKIKAPLFSTEARGRMGGLVYNTFRGISYVKAHTAPAQPRSQKVLQIRAWTIQLVRAWQALDAANIILWNQYAAAHPVLDTMNGTKRLTGANWFVLCNLQRLRMAAAPIATPPITAAPDAPVLFAAANGILQSVCTWTSPGGTDKTFEIWLFGPHSLGLLPKIQKARYYSQTAAETGTATVTGLRPGRYTFWARVIDDDNGLTSTWVSDTADVTAAKPREATPWLRSTALCSPMRPGAKSAASCTTPGVVSTTSEPV
jgi:hypothetical protein